MELVFDRLAVLELSAQLEDRPTCARDEHAGAFQHAQTLDGFVDATEVFFDPLVQFLSAEPVDTEDRSIAIGRNISLNILLVVHTERDDHIRIISARPPTRHERRLYEA